MDDDMETVDGFENELRDLINKNSVENASNTPDYILARYLYACLEAFEVASNLREGWYGRYEYPGKE